MRNLFSKLIDEEIVRDESYRSTLQNKLTPPPNTGLNRPGAPTSIALPGSVGTTPLVSPGTMVTPRANGAGRVPPTPGLAIGVATPGFAPLSTTLSTTTEEDAVGTHNGDPRTSTPEVQAPRVQPTPSATDLHGAEYFSTNHAAKDRSEASSESDKVPKTPGIGTEKDATIATPTSPTVEEKKKGLFGKKFGMGMSLTKKMTTRSSAEVKTPVATEEKSSDTASMHSSDHHAEKVHNIQDNFFGVVQRMRLEYDEHIEHKPDQPLPQLITPSLPIETPVITPPPHTTIIIQEDNPESGGLADLYRGEISELGNPTEVDTLENVAPMWLAELLLRVSCAPYLDFSPKE